ncbi:hypothetical protein [Kouleothrix sp.]|uniref:hypothetical protein n=1 Tax=Kouleothrix sp. TaxID=2779161 RepID=UPI00391B4C15
MVAAAQVALDGSVAAGPGAAELVAGAPCWPAVLYPQHRRPDLGLRRSARRSWQARPPTQIAPEQISAIVTHRGIYRPAMIARFLGDGDVPLDVISLHS